MPCAIIILNEEKPLVKNIGNTLVKKVLQYNCQYSNLKSIANTDPILEKILPIVLQYSLYCNTNNPGHHPMFTSFVLTQYRRVTDRQTGGRTEML